MIVLQLSDTHLEAAAPDPDDRSSPDAGVWRVLAALDRQPDLVLVTGDLTNDGSAAACRRLRGMLEPLGAPILAIPGNHDVPAAVAEVFGGGDAVDVGSWRVVAVDTTIPDHEHGEVDVRALEATLDADDQHPTLIALHHPPRSPSTGEMFRLAGADELLDACAARPHVRGIASGHLHEAFAMTVGELPIVGCPSTWYAITHAGDEYRLDPDGFVGAQLLELGDDGSLMWERLRG